MLSPARSAGNVSLSLREACRYWEMRRLPYNLALAAVFVAWLVFGPALGPITRQNLLALVVLALIANVFYCAAYPFDIALGRTAWSAGWRRYGRAVPWSLGTVLALALESYWIADEVISRLA